MISFNRFKKISWKLTFIYSSIFLLILLLLSASILYGVRYFIIQQTVKQLADTSKEIMLSIIGTAREQTDINDPELLEEAQTNHELNIKIFNSNGKVINSSNNFNTMGFSRFRGSSKVEIIKKKEQSFVLYTTPVIVRGQIKAYLQVAQNMEREYGFIKLLFIFLCSADVAGILLALVIIYMTSKRILKPIDKITNTAKNISVNDLNKRIDVGVADDELGRLAVTFNEMIGRLDESFKKQNRFVSDASHELRTPIGVIQGYINLIDRWGKYDENVLDESIKAMKIEINNMTYLIEELLFLARGDSGTVKLHKEEFNLSDLIEETVKDSKLIDTSHIIASEADSTISLSADRKMIKQMLRALVDNSMKFTPDNGEIKISAGRISGKIRIIVKDTGIGIPKEDIEKIFNRFYRVDKARSKDTGGTGLGLSIVNWIVEVHNGIIKAESESGSGTSIIIDLPEK